MAFRRIAAAVFISVHLLRWAASASRVVVDNEASVGVSEEFAEEVDLDVQHKEHLGSDYAEEAEVKAVEEAEEEEEEEDEDLAEELLNGTLPGGTAKDNPLHNVCPGELCPMECRCLSSRQMSHSALRASGHISEAEGERHRSLDSCAAVRGQRSRQRRIPEIDSCDERCFEAGMHGSRCLSRGKCECVVFGREYTWAATTEWEVQSTFPWIPHSVADRWRAPFHCYGTCRRLCALQHGRGTPWACAWPDDRLR